MNASPGRHGTDPDRGARPPIDQELARLAAKADAIVGELDFVVQQIANVLRKKTE